MSFILSVIVLSVFILSVVVPLNWQIPTSFFRLVRQGGYAWKNFIVTNTLAYFVSLSEGAIRLTPEHNIIEHC